MGQALEVVPVHEEETTNLHSAAVVLEHKVTNMTILCNCSWRHARTEAYRVSFLKDWVVRGDT
jgi:hypothetical protein